MRRKKKMHPGLYFSQCKFNRSVGEIATIYCQVVETKKHYAINITVSSEKIPQTKILELIEQPSKKYVKPL